MSWPTDGQPRYYVASIRGGSIEAGQSTGISSPEWYVHDRGYCHRIVARFMKGEYRKVGYESRTRGVTQERIYDGPQILAERRCAELNAL